jgi:hypothetical protein
MRALVILALVVLVPSAPASADNREEARRAFSAGQAADKAKDWQQAIKHYLHAFELVPHQFAAFNIGADYEQLGQLREASVWFGRYLDLAPPSKDRDKVLQRIADLRLRPAKLTVRSSPTGATVLIDGQQVGTTPYEHAIRGGSHRVAVELRGARDERDVVLEFGEPETVDLALSIPDAPEPETVTAPGTTPSAGDAAVLDVRGNPYGAHVAVDGADVGTVPVRVEVNPGPHQVTITRDGFAPYTTTAIATQGAVTPVEIALGLGSPARPLVLYVFGGGAGTDVRGLGQSYVAEFGVRVRTYDLAARVGKAFGSVSVEALVRIGYGSGRLVPFLSFGYSYIGSSPSYEAGAGLRFDLVQRPTYGVSLLGELAVRGYTVTKTDPVTMIETTDSGAAIPVMLSLQMMVGK